jgi:ketosteroid isomerase-like protein
VSQENVEIARRAWEASMRHDNEMALRLYDPEVTVEVTDSFDTPALYRGVDGVREWYRNSVGMFADLTVGVDEWIDAGDDVLAILHTTGRGRQSGVPVERRETQVWTVRNRKLWRLRIYETRAEALKAVGLQE